MQAIDRSGKEGLYIALALTMSCIARRRRRNAAWRQRRQVLQEAIPDSFWTALDRYDNGTWTAYTPGFAYEGAPPLTGGPGFSHLHRHNKCFIYAN